MCIQAGRHPIPAIWFCVDSLNHALIVLNSSLNFFIYCMVGSKFRAELGKLHVCLVSSCVAGVSTESDIL